MKAGLLQLVPHEHSGKVRHHRHTSYSGLLFALVLVGVLLLGSSLATQAAPPAVNPQSGSVGLSGTVRGPAPTTAAMITTPSNGTQTSTIPITVSGTCPANTFVNITKNGVFGGVTTCGSDGTFSLLIDLFDGSNALIARVSDALGQFGPDSAAVNVFYNAPTLNLPGGSTGRQLFLEVSTTVLGVDPGQEATRGAVIVGGVPPYAVSWDWGDGNTTLVSQAIDGQVASKHVYDRPGTYRVILRVTDAQGNGAFLQLITVVNGPVNSAGGTKGDGLGALPGVLLTAWPLYLLALAMVIFFWLGEKREISKLRKQNIQGV
jgi:hypothetical protein